MCRRIVITGANGRVGTAIGTFVLSTKLDINDGDLTKRVPNFEGFDAVIHLAGVLSEDLDSAQVNSTITFNLIRACSQARIKRLIWASSIRADEGKIGFPISWYGAEKAAQELFLQAWCAEDSARTAIALRFGHFNPESKPLPDTEIFRLEVSGLQYWIERALAHSQNGVTIWQATGCIQNRP